MNKYERIQFVKRIGLNTEENILIKPNTDIKEYFNFLKNLDEFSLRTFRKDDKITPHYPIISKKNLIPKINELQKSGYNLILATPINPKDCKFAGAAWKTLDKIVIEIANGPGTVRRVTHNNEIDKRYIINKFNILDNYPTEIKKCIYNFRRTKLDNVIFEFSWYNKLIGHKKENFICWEITDDGTKKSKIQ